MAKTKYLVYELYEVSGDSLEEVLETARGESTTKKVVIAGGTCLRDIPHPVHLAEAEEKFGHIGDGGKVAPELRDAKVDRDG